ncbi:MAG: antiterminator LoaP [Alistipes sp.]|nr:antiterminator LoaP [Alistipes sp.]
MWYVIWTITGREEQLKQEITRRLPKELYSKCRIPCRVESRKKDGKRIDVKRVLFPGYLFIETDDIEAVYMELRNLFRFSKLLKTGECYTPVSPDEERLIRRLTGDTEVVELSYGIMEGSRVVIHTGPLKGMEGYIKKIDRHKRKAYLQIEMFNRTVETCVGLEIVDKI